MKLADKNIFGEVPQGNVRGRYKKSFNQQAADAHKLRLKEIKARIRAEQKLMKANKISPHREGTARKFDELKHKKRVAVAKIAGLGDKMKVQNGL